MSITKEEGIDAVIDVSEMMDSSTHLHVKVGGNDVIVIIPAIDLNIGRSNNSAHGSTIKIMFAGDTVHIFDKESGKSLLE